MNNINKSSKLFYKCAFLEYRFFLPRLIGMLFRAEFLHAFRTFLNVVQKNQIFLIYFELFTILLFTRSIWAWEQKLCVQCNHSSLNSHRSHYLTFSLLVRIFLHAPTTSLHTMAIATSPAAHHPRSVVKLSPPPPTSTCRPPPPPPPTHPVQHHRGPDPGCHTPPTPQSATTDTRPLQTGVGGLHPASPPGIDPWLGQCVSHYKP